MCLLGLIYIIFAIGIFIALLLILWLFPFICWVLGLYISKYFLYIVLFIIISASLSVLIQQHIRPIFLLDSPFWDVVFLNLIKLLVRLFLFLVISFFVFLIFFACNYYYWRYLYVESPAFWLPECPIDRSKYLHSDESLQYLDLPRDVKDKMWYAIPLVLAGADAATITNTIAHYRFPFYDIVIWNLHTYYADLYIHNNNHLYYYLRSWGVPTREAYRYYIDGDLVLNFKHFFYYKNTVYNFRNPAPLNTGDFWSRHLLLYILNDTQHAHLLFTIATSLPPDQRDFFFLQLLDSMHPAERHAYLYQIMDIATEERIILPDSKIMSIIQMLDIYAMKK